MSWRAIERSYWARRALFMVANLALVGLAYFSAVEPVRRLLADRAESLSERRAALARYEAVIEQEGAVQEYAKQIRESNARGELISGESNGVAEANLQARLKSLAQRSGVSIRSIQMLPPRVIRGATLVGARIEVAGTLTPVHAFARALESETPLLIILTAVLRGQSKPWMVATRTNDQDLEGRFDVFGGALIKDPANTGTRK